MRVIHINANVTWNAFRGPSGAWVGVCDPLGLTVGGDTWSELLEASSQAIDLLLQDLLEESELESFLRTRGWLPTTPLPALGEDVSFDLPFFMSMADGSPRSSRALAQ